MHSRKQGLDRANAPVIPPMQNQSVHVLPGKVQTGSKGLAKQQLHVNPSSLFEGEAQSIIKLVKGGRSEKGLDGVVSVMLQNSVGKAPFKQFLFKLRVAVKN